MITSGPPISTPKWDLAAFADIMTHSGIVHFSVITPDSKIPEQAVEMSQVSLNQNQGHRLSSSLFRVCLITIALRLGIGG